MKSHYVLSFESYFRDLVDATEVAVPDKVARYLPPVRAFLDDKKGQRATKDHVPRAARILQAIVAEGVRRGLEMPKYAHGSVTFSTEHGEYTFELQELGSWSSERMYADEQERRIRRGTPAWQLAGYQEFTGNGKLRLRQGSPPSGYGSPTVGDRKIVRLEDRLTEVFVRFEVWRMERTHQVEQRKLAAERKERAWEAAMAKARVNYVADAKWQHFSALAKRAGLVLSQRQFLAQARESIQELSDNDRVAATEYLDEIQALINAHDPLTSPELITPVVKEPKDRELEPFLGGWSPYGP